MRSSTLLSTAALVLILLPAATAQEDGCTQADPCPWVTDVDADGFETYVEPFNGSLGDWVQIEAFNYDAEGHTLSLDAYGLAWDVASLDELQTEPFQLTEEGTFQLYDAPSGDSVVLQVTAGDPIEDASGTPTGENTPGADPERGIPDPGAPLLLGALALAGLAARRP